MHKYIVEQWRDEECIRKMEFTDEMVHREKDGSITITFPPHEFAGGLLMVTDDKLHVNEMDE